jgi:hypothetical protein
MGIRAASTRRATASTEVSGQVVAINSGTGFSVTGSTLTSNASISLGIVTPGVSSDSSTVTVASGPTIANIQYLDTNNAVVVGEIAVSTTGGNILINGSNFVANGNVYINNTLIPYTYINSSQIRAALPAAASSNVAVMVFGPTNVGTFGPNVRYSGAPTWVTSAVSFSNNTVANVALNASSDSTITYTLQSGSTLPTGISLSSAGYLTGTPTGYSINSSGTVVVIARDVEGQATQQTINWTVIAGDPQFYTTVFMMNADSGTNAVINANNAVFLDSSSTNATITKTGAVTQGSVSPFSQIGYSNNFNGTTDYLTLPSSTAYAFGTSNFTIEFWHFTTSQAQLYPALVSNQATATYAANKFAFYDRHNSASTKYSLYVYNISGATAALVSNFTPVNNTWYHIAIVRNGNTISLYVNGALDSSVTSAASMDGGVAQPISIGRSDSTSTYFSGYISNLRIINGTALYTTAFTPSSTPLTAVANTQLLTCQNNRFKDNSSNAAAITTNGTPSVQPFSPFAPTGTYTPSMHGGSIFCDGSTGYLTAPSNTNYNIDSGSTDSFICEFWVNFSAVGASMSIVDNGGLNGTSFQNWSIGLDASSIFQLVWGNSAAAGSQIGILSGTSVAKVGQWYHLALVKTNADWALFVNGAREITYNGLNTAAKSSASPLSIGYGISTGAGGARFKGYISNLRIYKGASASAPYAATSATITVPTSPVTAITNTQLLLNGTNGALIDSAGKFVFDTTSTTPPTVANTQTKFGNSISLTSRYMVNTVANPNLILGTGDFTIECWIYWVSSNYNGGVLGLSATTLTGQAIDFHSYNTTGYVFFAGSARSLGTITTGTWTHYALVRNNGVTKFYQDGVYNSTIGAVSDTTNYATVYLQVGYYQSYLASNTYVDDLRISKFARYTANFTPPSSAFLAQ